MIYDLWFMNYDLWFMIYEVSLSLSDIHFIQLLKNAFRIEARSWTAEKYMKFQSDAFCISPVFFLRVSVRNYITTSIVSAATPSSAGLKFDRGQSRLHR